jgi:branched-chain amino acid transport system ATP-binding protein
MGIARSFQRTNIFPKLTVFENIQAAFIAHGGKGLDMWGVSERQFRDETEQMIEQLALQGIAQTIAGEISHGAQKQVEPASRSPASRMLLLDEPTAGMSAQRRTRHSALDRIAKERALTLLFTSTTWSYSRSRTRSGAASGPHHRDGSDEVRRNEEVRRVYLGGGKH